MSYDELVAMSTDLQQAINRKKEEVFKKALYAFMDTYCVSKDEMKAILDSEESIISTTAQEEVVEKPQNKELLALPEPKEENKKESKTPSVFECPAIKAPYTTKPAKKGAITSSAEKTIADGTEENLPTMEDILSINPEYKALYAGEPSIKKGRGGMFTMDALLSEEPVNQILNLGNLEPEGKFGQHTRVCDPKGICPTLTATGNTTLVYLRS